MDSEPPTEGASAGVLTLTRLAGAGAIGFATALVAPQALVAVLFGGWVLAAAFGGLSAAVLMVGLSVVYRWTGGLGNARWWSGWVSVGGTGLAAAGAAAWWVSGQEFGRNPLLWQTALAAAFVVAAGAGTRSVRLLSALTAGAVVVASLSVLLPQVAALLPETERRGCIASSAEEAARECP